MNQLQILVSTRCGLHIYSTIVTVILGLQVVTVAISCYEFTEMCNFFKMLVSRIVGVFVVKFILSDSVHEADA